MLIKLKHRLLLFIIIYYYIAKFKFVHYEYLVIIL